MSRCRHGRSLYERGPCPLCESDYRIEELQSELAAERRKQDRDREQRRRENREAALRSQCEADSWEEAFWKGIARAKSEASGEEQDFARYGEEAGKPYFGPLVETWTVARVIYSEEMSKARAEILERIAARVEAELAGQEGAQELVDALRADNHLHLVDW